MPDNRQGGNASGGVSGSPAAEKIEDSMWRLKIQENREEGDDGANPYPDRPGEPDCIYYLRTGVCGYGSNCRYNHPSFTGQGSRYKAELPERAGQPDCLYFLKTGTCKFGATCKYHHPREKRDTGQVALNILGLPIRQDEKPCQYYMRTWSCKYGVACKFNHPPPSPVGAMLPMPGLSVYGAGGSSIASPSGAPLVGGFPSWPLPRQTYMSNTRMPGPAYMPVIVPSSQGFFPGQHGWTSYPGPLNPVPPDSLGHGQASTVKPQIAYPERPDQPECQYYMKTGNCKYGSSCKYNHPKERFTYDPFTIGPHGLPLRPGQAACTFYSTYGTCKYGLACKYDHPVAGYYAVPAIHVGDPSSFYPTYQRNSPSSTVAWVPSDPSPVRTLKMTENLKKADSPSINVENIDASAPEDPPPQDSPSQTAPSSGSPQDQSD